MHWPMAECWVCLATTMHVMLAKLFHSARQTRIERSYCQTFPVRWSWRFAPLATPGERWGMLGGETCGVHVHRRFYFGVQY
jgi:hypothetical protein